MRPSFIVLANAMVLTFSGCGSMLDRQPPSRDAYIHEYLEYFDTSRIEKLDYVSQGAIGGAMTVGRVKFQDSVTLDASLVGDRTLSGRLVTGTYDPTEIANEAGATSFRRQWEVHAGGSLPSWFDFPFDRKMRTLREEDEGRDGHPRYEKTWYIDDERNIVYIQANWG